MSTVGYRHPAVPWNGLTVTDLFCGAGGSSSGLVEAGYKVVIAANHWAGFARDYLLLGSKRDKVKLPSGGGRMTVKGMRSARVLVSAVTLARVPEPRAAQQSDCRPSCCRTPFTCARRYRCACHQGDAS